MGLEPKRKLFFTRVLCACALIFFAGFASFAQTALEEGWNNPPSEARLRAYWWWLNGNVTAASISHDLEEMKAKGFAGAVLVDANGASQGGNAPVPHGPTFMSAAWRKLFKHAVREADRLGLEISLNIQSGWNLGGPAPFVGTTDAAKKYVWSGTNVEGGKKLEVSFFEPGVLNIFYRNTYVIAFPAKAGRTPACLLNWKQKALQSSLQPFSAPDTSPLFAELPSRPGEEDTKASSVLDLTDNLGPDGVLGWDAPPGQWEILRFGYTIGDHSHVSTASDEWGGYALDVYDEDAFQHYWNAVVEPLIADAGPLAGRSLKYLHTDSWEIELANWTPKLRAEFKQRRGYDMLPWLPVLAGEIVNNRDESDRFLADYRKTLGDLAIDHHYKPFRDKAHAHGLLIHPESGGPHAVPIDAQRCLGWDDAPMSEFWAWSWEHRIGDSNRFFVKQPASAAHTYGHHLVFAEGFTDIGPHWQESLWSNLKPSFDKAICEGLNVLVWHAFVCSPDETGIPGQQYFAGTHLNPKVTWWEKSKPFFNYINRCQFMMQQGLPVADVLYYYGDHVPNFAQLKMSDPAGILPGYDYDVITEEALLTRAQARHGRIVLPDGMSYRILVLPKWPSISLPVLRKLKELIAAGATIVGKKPIEPSGLQNFPACDAEFAKLASELYVPGKIITNQTAREVLTSAGVNPDFDWDTLRQGEERPEVDFVHRATAQAEIYFVMNRSSNATDIRCSFRVAERAPELWDAVNGEHRFATDYVIKNGRVELPIHFAPCGSTFVVFRDPSSRHPATQASNWRTFGKTREIEGPWTVRFDPKWGGPASIKLSKLESWTERRESGVKYYSGTAIYSNSFTMAKQAGQTWLDLGEVRELAQVRVNGHDCGIAWSPPFRVEVSGALRDGLNSVEVEVVNFWPNRIIGDQSLPAGKRFTQTNIRQLKATTPLMTSGLLGPVTLMIEQ